MKKHFKKIIIIVIIVSLLVLGFFFNQSEPSFSLVDNEDEIIYPIIIVEIKGEVMYPGIYNLQGDQRIYDAIRAAGGLKASADISEINLAEKVKDGTAICIPKKSSLDEKKISINTASLEELMRLQGIGEVKARNIIKYRQEEGKFNRLEDLKNVEGISEKLYQQIKEYICL